MQRPILLPITMNVMVVKWPFYLIRQLNSIGFCVLGWNRVTRFICPSFYFAMLVTVSSGTMNSYMLTGEKINFQKRTFRLKKFRIQANLMHLLRIIVIINIINNWCFISFRYKVNHFITKTHRNQSLIKTLGILVYQCELCAQWFSSVSQLHTHRNHYHPRYDNNMQIVSNLPFNMCT